MRILISLFFIFLFYGCGDTNNRRDRRAASKNVADTEEVYSDEDIIAYLDAYCGYPGDPELPEEYLGATEEVLAGRDGTELFTLMESALPIAEQRVRKTPRLLFEVARAGYRLGYYDRAEEWMERAATSGSAGALAWLGSYHYDAGSIDLAIDYIEKTTAKGFKARWATTILTPSTNESAFASFSEFSRPEIIEALWTRDYTTLRRLQQKGAHDYLKSLNDALINPEVLFIIDDPSILHETVPEISTIFSLENKFIDEFRFIYEGGARIGDKDALAIAAAPAQGKHDGYRLATIYTLDYDAFQRIYGAMSDYALNHLND